MLGLDHKAPLEDRLVYWWSERAARAAATELLSAILIGSILHGTLGSEPSAQVWRTADFHLEFAGIS